MPKSCPILLLTRSLGLGGTERQLAEIAKALDRSAFTPYVGCFHAEGFRAGELRSSGVPVVEFPVTSFVRPSVISGLAVMGRYIREHKIQLVHTFDVPLNLFGVPAARLFRVPFVLSSQRAHRALTPGIRRRMLRLTDHLVDGIVVNSEAVQRELIEVDRVPPRLLHLCYNGIDAAFFQSSRSPAEGPIIIGVICALRPEKGLETLLEAFARLNASQAIAHLWIVGSGPSLPLLQELAQKLNLGARCTFAPATKDVTTALQRIDIFVLPSLSEALSNSLMEAMASGCCVVASKTGGNPELVMDQQSGLLFPPGDSAALAACLDLLLRNPSLRTRLAAAGAERIRTEFTLARAARRMAEIYGEVLGSAARSFLQIIRAVDDVEGRGR
jgi:glycosyltransferase involved in cell wall biosynthesis